MIEGAVGINIFPKHPRTQNISTHSKLIMNPDKAKEAPRTCGSVLPALGVWQARPAAKRLRGLGGPCLGSITTWVEDIIRHNGRIDLQRLSQRDGKGTTGTGAKLYTQAPCTLLNKRGFVGSSKTIKKQHLSPPPIDCQGGHKTGHARKH